MINPYYFTDRTLQVGFNITVKSPHINHANSKLTTEPKFSAIGIESRYNNEMSKEMATVYAR